jgi:hypothetical protein
MKKILLLISTIFVFNLNAQVYTVKSFKFTKTEGLSAFIDVRNSMGMNMTMGIKFSITAKSSGAVVASDLSNINPSNDTILFQTSADTVKRVTFNTVLDNLTEGNDTFVFKIHSPFGMPGASIGSPDSIIFIVRDSVIAPVTGKPYRTIGSLRLDSNNDGVSDSVGVSCTIRGVLHGTNFKTPGYQMAICDGTGCMNIFSGKPYPSFPTANEGDSVEVAGTVDEFRGLAQLKFSNAGDTIILKGTKSIYPIQTVSILNEYSESRLVKMDNMVYTSGTWLADSAFDIKMKTTTNVEYVVRINNKPSANFSAIALIKAGKKYSITGIGGQFDPAAAAPKTTGYQIIPRKSADIVETGNAPSGILASEINGFSVYPSIISNSTTIKFNSEINDIAKLELIDLQGKIVRTQDLKIISGENQVLVQNLNNLPNGNYIITLTGSMISAKNMIQIAK